MQNKLPSNKYLRKAWIVLIAIMLAILFILARRNTIINNRYMDILRSNFRTLNASNQLSSFPSSEAGNEKRSPGKKIIIAFRYWEQLTKATQNLLDLTALAAYGGRQVVVPFVKDSQFYGSPAKQRFETLALYYNVTALNRTLRSRGHGTLISWKEFQDVCRGKLDVLVHFDYTYLSNSTAEFPCKDPHWNTFQTFNFTVGKTICVNVFAVDSIAKFENEVVKRLPCVGLTLWTGSNIKSSNEMRRHRTKFNLSSVVADRMSYRDASVLFSLKLIHLARTFIERNLAPFFVSVHIRVERILAKLAKLGTSLNISIATVEKCISNVTTLVQRYRNVSTAHIPVFLATDFADYGSWSPSVKLARQNAKSLMKILAPLQPVMFQPSAYNLTDRGAVAIVEMNILASGEHLVVVGGGHFQDLVVNQFLNKKNSTDQRNALLEQICQYGVVRRALH
ncbi:uncharacterized protein LOC144635448 [Oculina patagonica]